MSLLHRLRRVFTRLLPRPAPKFEYLPESALPDDPAELIRAGVIRPWRVECTGERWFVADRGAIEWYKKYLGGPK